MRAGFVASARTYRAHRIWRDVVEAGFSCGLHKIERLMRAQALRARPTQARPCHKDDGGNLQPQQYLAECARPPVQGGPARRQPANGIADFTYVWMAEGLATSSR